MNQQTSSAPIRDRIPVLTKISYGLGTALDMWGFWLYAGVAYAVFNMYLKVPALWVGIALFGIRIIDAMVDPGSCIRQTSPGCELLPPG